MYALNDVTPSAAQYSTVRTASSGPVSSCICGPAMLPLPSRYGPVIHILRTGHAAGIDELLHVEVGVGLQAAGGARGGDAAGQIEARKAEGLLGVHGNAAARGIEEMLVHADQSGDDGGAAEVEKLRAGRTAWSAAHGGDFAMVDDDGLVLDRRRAGAIDDAHVLQCDNTERPPSRTA